MRARLPLVYAELQVDTKKRKKIVSVKTPEILSKRVKVVQKKMLKVRAESWGGENL